MALASTSHDRQSVLTDFYDVKTGKKKKTNSGKVSAGLLKKFKEARKDYSEDEDSEFAEYDESEYEESRESLKSGRVPGKDKTNVSSSSECSEGSDQESNEAAKAFIKLLTKKQKKKSKFKPGLKHPRYVKPGPKQGQEILGPNSQEGAPEFLENVFHSLFPRKEVKEKLESIQRPANCPALKPVMINKEIYSRMDDKERKFDEPMKFISNGVAKASQPLAAAWNELLEVEDALRAQKGDSLDDDAHVELQITNSKVLDLTKVIELLDQSLSILGMTNCQVVQRRRWDL